MNTAERDSRRVLKNGGMGGPTLSGSASESEPLDLIALAHRGRSPRPADRRGYSGRARAERQPGAEAFADQVRVLWRERQGLPNPWPRERRHDAILIGQAIRRYHLPLDFWQALFATVPLGASFRLLMTRSQKGGCWLDRAATEWREQRPARGGLLPLAHLTTGIVGGLLKRLPA